MKTKLVKIPAGIPNSVILEAIKLHESEELDNSDVTVIARKLDGIGGLEKQTLLRSLKYMLRPGFKTLRQAPQDVAETATTLLVSILNELASDRLSLTRIAKDVKSGKNMPDEHVAGLAAWDKVKGEDDEKKINTYFDGVSAYLEKHLNLTSTEVDDILSDLSVMSSRSDYDSEKDVAEAKTSNPTLFKAIQDIKL